MKKIMLMFSILVMSIFVFADGNICKISNGPGNVTLVHNNAQSDKDGSVSVSLKLSGDATARRVNVVVYCYDASTKKFVDSKSATIIRPETKKVTFQGVIPNHAYYFTLSDATCQ